MPTSSKKHTQDVSKRRILMVDALNTALETFFSHSEKTFEEVMTNVLQPIAEAAGVDRIYVDRRIETNGENRLERMYRWEKSDSKLKVEEGRFLLESKILAEWMAILRQGDCINRCLSDMSEDERAIVEKFSMKAIFIVPIFVQTDFWGSVVFLNSENEQYFDEDCLDLIKSFARLCANAIMHDEMEIEIAKQNEINKKIAKEAAEAERRTRIMLDAVPLCCQLWTSDYKIIDCNKTALELFGLNNKQEFIENFTSFSPEYQPDGQLSREESRRLVNNAFSEGRCIYDWMHILPDGTHLPVETTLVRVRYKGEYVVVGFTRDLRQIKKMENNILRLETESEKIYYDPLTGIYNRRFFDENLTRVIHTLSRSRGALGLMMIDIDFFKSYNDTYGHSAGDECIKTIAEILSKNTARADDFVTRYGGDEFAIVLPNTEEDGARMIAEKILKSVWECGMFHEKSDLGKTVTVSIGVATGKVKSKHRADDFILRADELLYKSKQGGRNKYTFGNL